MTFQPDAGSRPRATPNPEKALLGILGLASRARQLTSGTERVREAVRSGAAKHVLLANDVASAQRDKIFPLLQATQVPHTTVFGRVQLGAAIGRSPVSAIALLDAGFARRVAELVGELDSQGP